MRKNYKHKFLLLICLLGIIIRVVYILAFATYIKPPDWEYGDIAHNLNAGHGYSRIGFPSDTLELTSSHAPFYPHVLAFFYSLLDKPWSYLSIQILQTIISVMIIAVVFRTTRMLFDKNAAYVAALGAAIYPPLVYYSASITPTVFTLFFLSLTVMIILENQRQSWTRSFFLGLSYGCALLSDPIMFALIPAVGFWFITSKKRITRFVMSALVLAILVVLPWTLRNHRVHNALVPVTTQFGVNFWIGNNPLATGTDYYRVIDASSEQFTLMTETLPRAAKQEMRQMNEIQRTRYYAHLALEYIVKKPFATLWLLVKKTFYYWWFSPSSINGSLLAMQYRWLYVLFYIPLLLFAFLGFVIFKLEHQPASLNLILALLVMISSMYIFTHVGLGRYRIPVELYLLIIASSAKNRLFKMIHT
jgi:4-amino-4-deoxy-L-arabinose transferase-like glycosyltransferase